MLINKRKKKEIKSADESVDELERKTGIKQFEICTHPTIKSFHSDDEFLKGYWVDATQFAKLTNKNKSVIIGCIATNTLPPDLIHEKINGINYFFISLEDQPYSYIEAKLFRFEELLDNTVKLFSLLAQEGINSDKINMLKLEDLVINGKTIYEIQGIKTKIKGFWLNTDMYSKLVNKSKNLILMRIKNNAMPHGTQIILGKQPTPHQIFVVVSKPTYSKEDAALFLYKHLIYNMKSTMSAIDNMPAWKDISSISRIIASTPGLAESLISISRLGSNDLNKMYEFNKKLMKLFPDG